MLCYDWLLSRCIGYSLGQAHEHHLCASLELWPLVTGPGATCMNCVILAMDDTQVQTNMRGGGGGGEVEE